MSEINLATEKQMVLDLKAELSKAKEATRLAREAAEAAVAASYDRGVVDTEARLTEEVATVCRDYITMSWGWPWTRRQFLQTPTSGRLRISSFLKIFARFRARFLLKSPSLLRSLFRIPSYLKPRRCSHLQRTSCLRTPS